jgi:hypothetical protein
MYDVNHAAAMGHLISIWLAHSLSYAPVFGIAIMHIGVFGTDPQETSASPVPRINLFIWKCQQKKADNQYDYKKIYHSIAPLKLLILSFYGDCEV